MSANPAVSIVLPVYNGMPHVEWAIVSILKQTFTDWELIVVDDGSTDASISCLPAIAERCSQIHLLSHAVNCGVAAAYNTGIRHARGRFLAFQEQDDISVPQRLEQQLSALHGNNVTMVTSRVGWLNEKHELYRLWPDEMPTSPEFIGPGYKLYCRLLIHQTIYSNATTMIDRSRIDISEPWFDESFRRSGQDWDFHLRLVRRHATLRLREPLVLMQRNPQHASSTSHRESVFRSSRAVLRKHWRLHRKFRHRPDVGTFRKALSNQFLIEARYYRRLKGRLLGALSLALWPANPAAHRSLRNAVSNS